ncbi:hypothetical protein BO99DRAFT_78131 [Aspergillus violaceofuscus CBS 115571]|uniref:Uncharacterized protein n=1 Tax=Aspergillus violaceofuscus (strain CBS 115571) TaxID=1450538 RepID=A0A2V5HZU0_ASPV1|nr:hypothetical protein BO99DRAFT_78131 [Aspergillus violaceofuscus CBS 115571]
MYSKWNPKRVTHNHWTAVGCMLSPVWATASMDPILGRKSPPPQYSASEECASISPGASRQL